METQHNGFRLERRQWIFVSAMLGTVTMVAVLVAAIVGAPESAFIGICLGGLGAMFAAAYIGQLSR